MKVFLSGGGTLGPVIPLLAIKDALQKQHAKINFIWVGTKNGPEREVVANHHTSFFIIGAGKWRRYFSLLNILDPIKILIAFVQSIFLLWQEKPNLLISAGGYVSVPLHWAAGMLGIPTWVHQQDVKIGLANKLMAPFAKKITIALEETKKDFKNKNKIEWIGNPSRNFKNLSKQKGKFFFKLPLDQPVILAMGGGTGSSQINSIMLEALERLPKNAQVIHIVGKERPTEMAQRATRQFSNYHVYKFFTHEMEAAYAAADVVVARAGFGTLTELAILSKPAIILPMFGSHQEDNAKYFASRGGIIMLNKGQNSGVKLAKIIEEVLNNKLKQQSLGKRMHELLPAATSANMCRIYGELVLN